jgi:hypothetical protein
MDLSKSSSPHALYPSEGVALRVRTERTWPEGQRDGLRQELVVGSQLNSSLFRRIFTNLLSAADSAADPSLPQQPFRGKDKGVQNMGKEHP